MSVLRQCATPQLHEEAFAYLEGLRLPPSAAVLDLGGGTGAWGERLRQRGFQEVDVMDWNRAQFEGQAQFIEGDLNADFSQLLRGRKYQLITGLEVIEHLENPTHFLRECGAVLAPGGVLLITSPNVESMPARLKFLLSGRLRHFDQNGDKTHLTPIDSFLMGRLAARAGLLICEQVPVVRYWHDRRWWFLLLARLLAAFVGGSPYGACHLFVLRAKTDPAGS